MGLGLPPWVCSSWVWVLLAVGLGFARDGGDHGLLFFFFFLGLVVDICWFLWVISGGVVRCV